MLCRATKVAHAAGHSKLASDNPQAGSDSHNLQALQDVRQLRHNASAQEVSNSNNSGLQPSCMESLAGLKASDAHRGPCKASDKPLAVAASKAAAAVLPAEASSPIRQGSSSVCSEVETLAACQHCLCSMCVMHFWLTLHAVIDND